MKKARIVGSIGTVIISLITGLSLGLKCAGSDMVVNTNIKARKLTPSEKKEITPWIELERAAGKSIVQIGDKLYLIIGGTIFYLALKK